jgi:lipid II:glycine glycyltransferase (peptidoglycan interpeptide bridge formation enzyme)
MRKTTRYLIRKGLKDEIAIKKISDDAAIDEFWKLYKVTFSRENFTPFPKKFILKEFQLFNKTNNSLFFLGGIPPKFAQEGLSEFQAASLVLFTKSSGFYHQGASVHTPYPVTYVLQWNAILEAKRRGCKFYNFYGIYKHGRTPSAWKGLTLFKQGFGGFQIDYLPTQDYVVSPKYYFSFAVDKYLSWKRGI